jgi:hypothetical protein
METAKQQNKIAHQIMDSGMSFQLEMLLSSLKREVESGYRVCNPNILVGGSLRNSIYHWIKDDKLPKTKKKAYEYLVKKGYYDFLKTILGKE